MTGQRRFRILGSDGLLSGDTFVLPASQPHNLPAGCVCVAHEHSGVLMIVRDARIFPASAIESPPFSQRPMSTCAILGQVGGPANDAVACRNGGGRFMLQSYARSWHDGDGHLID